VLFPGSLLKVGDPGTILPPSTRLSSISSVHPDLSKSISLILKALELCSEDDSLFQAVFSSLDNSIPFFTGVTLSLSFYCIWPQFWQKKEVLLAIASVIVLIIIKKKTIGMMAIVFCCYVKITFHFNYVKELSFHLEK
jgi:hypothetical protein